MGGDIHEYKVIFSRKARSDLKHAVVYVRAASASPQIAERLGIQLVEKALTLSTMPDRGRMVPEIRLDNVREIIFKSYRIIYRVREHHVEILRFWHASRGAPEISVHEFEVE